MSAAWSKHARVAGFLELLGLMVTAAVILSNRRFAREQGALDPEIAWERGGFAEALVRGGLVFCVPALAGILAVVIVSSRGWRGTGEVLTTMVGVVMLSPAVLLLFPILLALQ